MFDYNKGRRGSEKERKEEREIESKRTEEASTAYSVVLHIENEQYNKNQTTPEYNPIDTSVYFFSSSLKDIFYLILNMQQYKYSKNAKRTEKKKE